MSTPRSDRSLRYDYNLQGRHAVERGIAWEITFEEWLRVWKESGHLNLRGKGVGRYCMSRYGDAGPYAVGNVCIKLLSENSAEGHRNKPYLTRPNTIGRIGTGIAGGWGVRFSGGNRKKPWKTMFRSRLVGYFETEKEGRAAYVKAATAYLNSQGKTIPDTLKA